MGGGGGVVRCGCCQERSTGVRAPLKREREALDRKKGLEVPEWGRPRRGVGR